MLSGWTAEGMTKGVCRVCHDAGIASESGDMMVSRQERSRKGAKQGGTAD